MRITNEELEGGKKKRRTPETCYIFFCQINKIEQIMKAQEKKTQ